MPFLHCMKDVQVKLLSITLLLLRIPLVLLLVTLLDFVKNFSEKEGRAPTIEEQSYTLKDIYK